MPDNIPRADHSVTKPSDERLSGEQTRKKQKSLQQKQDDDKRVTQLPLRMSSGTAAGRAHGDARTVPDLPPAPLPTDAATGTERVVQMPLHRSRAPLSPRRELNPLGHSILEQLASEAAAKKIEFKLTTIAGKNPARRILENEDPSAHLALARKTPPPNTRGWDVEPTMKFALDKLDEIGAEVTRWRSDLLEEMRTLHEDLQGNQDQWWCSLDEEVRRAYGQGAIHAPMFTHLLRRFAYPDAYKC